MTKRRRKERKTDTFFRKILMPLGILVIIEILLLFGVIFGGGITEYLDQYARDILQERVINRKNYIENEMVGKWSDIEYTAERINARTQELIDRGELSLGLLDESPEQSGLLIMDIHQELISLIRNNRVTGAFVVFNGADLDKEREEGGKDKQGLYLRDLDPIANASVRNQDLLIERAPVDVVRQLDISTDSGWMPRFEYKGEGNEYSSFLYEPFQAAYKNGDSGIKAKDFGYWSPPYFLNGNNKQVISYSVPLILKDGSVYGVLGIELTCDYLKKLLPAGEIADNKRGTYILGLERPGRDGREELLISGQAYEETQNSGDFYFVEERLNLYNMNTTFAQEKWSLIGAVGIHDLYAFSESVTRLMLFLILITSLVGVAGIFIISRQVSKPVVALAADMERADPAGVVELQRTGIREIDLMADAIENLSYNVINSATRFSRILQMASVQMAGFEINWKDKTLFVSEDFFRVFCMDGIDTSQMSYEKFCDIMESLEPYHQDSDEESFYYKIPTEGGDRYVRLRHADDGVCRIGLAEDVTRATLERNLIEYERDHDLLTGLINRRAFYREMHQLFGEKKDQLKTAAMVMMDLDNLKSFNDTYGHDTGDKYIRSAAECFLRATPKGTIISRISGDEFYLFFYGYNSREALRQVLLAFQEKVKQSRIQLPNQKQSPITASGGVAWYPDDSTSYEELLHYSDFAMYKVKQSMKGDLGEFDLGIYNKDAYLIQAKTELNKLIEQEQVTYFFQPIIHGKTGEIFAYEALMRADMTMLHNPAEILALAKQESKLNQIEILTWKKSLESFVAQMEAGTIEKGCRLFINSIASQIMDEAHYQEIEDAYGDYLEQVVLEVTEEEEMDETILGMKKEKVAKWNAALALDDYGSGYNNEKNLLRLAPQFIKVDLSIIRDIDKNADKQTIMANIVSYAHERGMYIVAEGIETREETIQVIQMGADYLQGYYFAKPQKNPVFIREESRQLLKLLQGEGRAGEEKHGTDM